jgi:hypothetical protein
MKKYFTLRNIGWVSSFIVFIILFNSAIIKTFPNRDVINNFSMMNMLDYLPIISLFELVGALLFLTTRYSSIGASIISVIMGGACVAHIISMDSAGIEFPIIVMLFTWFGYFIREYTK